MFQQTIPPVDCTPNTQAMCSQTVCDILTFASVGEYESVRTVQDLPKGERSRSVLVRIRCEFDVHNFVEHVSVHLSILLWTQTGSQTHKVAGWVP